MTLPTGVGTGTINGRFVLGVIDSPYDDDNDPELIPAQGRITFVPNIPYDPYVPDAIDGVPMTILRASITGVLDSEGYLCTPDNTSPSGFTRGVKLFSTDTGMVTNWTYTVKYSFTSVNNVSGIVPDHPLSVPNGSTQDLTTIVRVPSSPGVGTPQIEATARRAEQAAVKSLESSLVSAEEARLAKEAALRAEQSSQVIDTGVAALLNDPESESSTALTTFLLVKADKTYVDSELSTKATSTELTSGLSSKADKTYVDEELAGKASTTDLDGKADVNHTHPVVSELSDGLMTSSDKSKLDDSSASNVPSTLVQRNSVGNFSVAEATSPTHPATKGYVDTELSKKVNTETLNAELETKVEPIVSSYIASQPAVVDSAAAAVNAEVAEYIIVKETAGRTVSIWDYLNNREQLIYGDTGERDISALFTAGGTHGGFTLRRVGQICTLTLYNWAPTEAGSGSIAVLPHGFRPTVTYGVPAQGLSSRIQVTSAGNVQAYSWTTSAVVGSIVWITSDPWPTTLPGVAV